MQWPSLFLEILLRNLLYKILIYSLLLFKNSHLHHISLSILLLSTYLHYWIWSEFHINSISLGCIFLIHSTTLCLLIDLFRSFTFNVTIDTLRLKSAILFSVFCLFSRFFFSLFFPLHSNGLLEHVLEFHFDLFWVFECIYLYRFLSDCSRYYVLYT